MNNEKSKARIPPIPLGVSRIQVKFFDNQINKLYFVELHNLFRKIEGRPFNSWKEVYNGEV